MKNYKKCPFCGEEIPSKEIICPICGETLPSHYKKKRWIIPISIGAAVFVIASLIITLTRNGNHDESSAYSSEVEDVSSEIMTYDSEFENLENGDEGIPEGMWTHSTFIGTLSGNGKSYQIELSISYPGNGDSYCEVKGGYRYKGHPDLIALEGDWIELNMGREIMLCLYSDEFLERFDLEFDSEDLISTSSIVGTWSKYANEDDYTMVSNPSNELTVRLKENN